MHRLLFAMKRSYHRSLARAAPLVRPFGLTPARYDLMFLLFTRGGPAQMRVALPAATQMELRRALGVSRETVRRMLVGLEDKGYIVRGKPPTWYRDRRTRIVRLTDRGRSMVRRATKLLFPDGLWSDTFERRREPLQIAFEHAASSARTVDRFARGLRALAQRFGEFATLLYPSFDPDD